MLPGYLYRVSYGKLLAREYCNYTILCDVHNEYAAFIIYIYALALPKYDLGCFSHLARIKCIANYVFLIQLKLKDKVSYID